MKYLRGMLSFIYMIFSTTVIIIYATYLHRYPKEKMIEKAIAAPRWWFAPLFFISGIKVKLTIKDKIPDPPVLFFATHRGNLDIPLLSYSLPGGVTYLAKEELFSVPVLSIILDTIGSIPVKREQTKGVMESIKSTMNLLHNNINVVVFPEGTRTRNGKIGQIKRGGLMLAKTANIPIVPVIIKDGFIIYPRKSIFPNSGTVEIIVEKPIDPAQYNTKELASLLENLYNSYFEEYR